MSSAEMIFPARSRTTRRSGLRSTADVERCGAEANGGSVLRRLHIHRFAARLRKDCPRSVFGKILAWGDAHADDVIAKGSDAQACRTGLNLNAVALGRGSGYGLERSIGLRGL